MGKWDDQYRLVCGKMMKQQEELTTSSDFYGLNETNYQNSLHKAL
ncbi:hypothetical protein SNF32_07255 [Enterococcus mundtii]|nr:hypothetical protein [Enterococcus mundtii]